MRRHQSRSLRAELRKTRIEEKRQGAYAGVNPMFISILGQVIVVAVGLIVPSSAGITCGSEFLVDGNFDNLPVGTAPDNDSRAGAWGFDHVNDLEGYPELYTIVETSSFDPTRTGNSLFINYRESFNDISHLTNLLNTPIPEAGDGFVRFGYEVFVPGTGGGTGAIILGGDHGGGGPDNRSDRGPQLSWGADPEGREDFRYWTTTDSVLLMSEFPRNEWQRVQLDIDLVADNFDLYWATGDSDLELIASDATFRSGRQRVIDRVTLLTCCTDDVAAYVDNFTVEYISTLSRVTLTTDESYVQNFDSLGSDQTRGLMLPTGWSGSDQGVFFEPSTTKLFPVRNTGRGTLIYNAGSDQDPDRALALGIGSTTERGTLQMLADVEGTGAGALQVAFDIEAWDAVPNRVDIPGEAAFEVSVEIDHGDGFQPLLDIGRVTTGAVLELPVGEHLDGNSHQNRVSFNSGPLAAQIPASSTLRIRWSTDPTSTSDGWVFGVDNVSVSLLEIVGARGDLNRDGVLDINDLNRLTSAIQSGDTDLQFDLDQNGVVSQSDRSYWVTDLKHTWFGDSNLDGRFDSTDLVIVFSAGEYEDNISLNSNWAEGDWNGDGDFDSGDLVVAFRDGGYESGPRAVANVPEPLTLTSAFIPIGLIGLFAHSRETVARNLIFGRRQW